MVLEQSFEKKLKGIAKIINVQDCKKKIGYEIPFNGRIFRTNKDNLIKLEDKDWNKN